MSISPPRASSPSLNAMRAFEAAARHGSFTIAANELCVTPGAVAQQVKSLEAWCGARLFKRQAHGISLTPLGAAVLPVFVNAFDGLGAAVQTLRSQATPRQVRIAALPSVAQLWLSPRLPGIRSEHENLEISVVATEFPPNLKRELFDLSIFFETLPGDDDNLEICRDLIFPVCTPKLANKIKVPGDLAKLPCLHDTSWSDDWTNWLQIASPGDSIDTSGPTYSLYSLMLEEAQHGAGVMIGHESLVWEALQSGALVAPLATKVQLNRRLAIATASPLKTGSTLDKIIGSLSSQGCAQ